jgi:hypothetical protein
MARACCAYAALHERDYVIPDDVQALAVPVLAHRLLPAVATQCLTPEQIVTDLVQRLPLAAATLTRLDPEERQTRRASLPPPCGQTSRPDPPAPPDGAMVRGRLTSVRSES